jgi:glycosyltransferase involved in cell wall biosynthesis
VFATHDDPPDRLHETIATLRAQTYGRWELCIGDAGSTNEATWEALADADASSARISVAFGHPAGNEGEAIAAAYRLAGGSYVAFPGRLKRFAPDALERCVEALRAVPEADVLFADSDLIDAGRFTLIRREFVNKLGGPRAALAASHAADVVAHLAGRTEHVHSL